MMRNLAASPPAGRTRRGPSDVDLSPTSPRQRAGGLPVSVGLALRPRSALSTITPLLYHLSFCSIGDGLRSVDPLATCCLWRCVMSLGFGFGFGTGGEVRGGKRGLEEGKSPCRHLSACLARRCRAHRQQMRTAQPRSNARIAP